MANKGYPKAPAYQPAYQPATAPVISNQPFINQKPLSQLTYDNKFAYGFCDCCEDCKVCCTALWCFPCFLCCLYRDAGESKCSACWQCFSSAICLQCTCCSHFNQLRTKIRGTFKLHGSILEDIFYSTCCPCCSAIQMKQELIARNEAD